MAVESTAVFKERVGQLGLDGVWGKFEEAGLTSYGMFAYSSAYTPGSADDACFVKDVVVKLLGSSEHVLKAALRRLYFESYTVATAELRRRHERTEDEAPRKIPASEKEDRRARLADRLKPGLVMEAELDPSYHLIDLACQMHDDNCLLYIPWEACGKRSQDHSGGKKDRQWKPDASGIVRERVVEQGVDADLGTDLLLQYALQRRGLAMEIADLMDYETHQLWVTFLLSSYMSIPPANYAKLTLEQICKADQEIFKMLQQTCRAGIRRTVAGSRPLEAALKEAMSSHRVAILLSCLPRAAGAERGRDTQRKQKRDRTGSSSTERGAGQSRAARKRRAKTNKLAEENQRLKKEMENLRRQGAERNTNNEGNNRDKGKGKGKKGKDIAMPRALLGKSAFTADGEPICFAWNLPQGCKEAKAGERCNRGWHVAMPTKR